MLQRPCSCLSLGLVLGCSAILPSGLHAQTAVPDATGRLVFKANARIVVLDVVVTGAKGGPVDGLRKQDFAVTEDGRPQQITSFEEHTAAAEPVLEPLPPLPANIFTNIPRVKQTDSVTVLLLDSLNTPIEGQSYVRTQMMKYLKSQPAGKRMAIFALGNRLRSIQGFTDDPALLAAALTNAKSGSAPRASALQSSNAENDANQGVVANMYQNFAAHPSGVTLQSLQSVQQFQAEQVSFNIQERTDLTIDALQQLARYLAGIPGRKNVVWFSGAFPLDIFPNPDLSDTFVAERKNDYKIHKLDALLSAAEVAMYPIAAEGNSTDSLYDADQAFHGKINMLETTGALGSQGPQTQGQTQGEQALGMEKESLQNDSVRRNADHTTMDQIAHDTGGEAIYNTNGLEQALARAIDHGSRFYTLTYTPTNADADGRYRKIAVKVAASNSGASYKLAYRRGYFAASAKSVEMATSAPGGDPLHPFMGPGMPASTQIPLALRVLRGADESAADSGDKASDHGAKLNQLGDNPKIKGPLTRYRVDFVIASRGLELDPTPDGGRHGSIESTIVVYDQAGRPVNWIVRRVNLDMDAKRYAQVEANGVNFDLLIDVPKAAASIRGGVYDQLSNLAGTLEVPLGSVVNDTQTASAKTQ